MQYRNRLSGLVAAFAAAFALTLSTMATAAPEYRFRVAHYFKEEHPAA